MSRIINGLASISPDLATGRSAIHTQKTRLAAGFLEFWQPRMDSNHRMPESESGALPLGDGAVNVV